MLDKVCKVHIQASSAQLLPGSNGMGLILHATLQELRILKESKVALIKNHPLIRYNMVTDMFNTYIPSTELDLAKLGTFSLETKYNKFDKLVAVQRKLIDSNSTVVGNLQWDTKKYHRIRGT